MQTVQLDESLMKTAMLASGLKNQEDVLKTSLEVFLAMLKIHGGLDELLEDIEDLKEIEKAREEVRTQGTVSFDAVRQRLGM